MTWGGRGVVVPLVLNKTRPYRHPVMTWGEGCCGAIGAEQDQTIPSSSHDLGGRGAVVPLVLNKTRPYRHPVMTWGEGCCGAIGAEQDQTIPSSSHDLGGGVLWCHWC
ncbi:hypothetical protein ACOMHN_058460 [Nucella lapillus]